MYDVISNRHCILYCSTPKRREREREVKYKRDYFENLEDTDTYTHKTWIIPSDHTTVLPLLSVTRVNYFNLRREKKTKRRDKEWYKEDMGTCKVTVGCSVTLLFMLSLIGLSLIPRNRVGRRLFLYVRRVDAVSQSNHQLLTLIKTTILNI